ncbi:MAG: twitch domain-containing radical SAM protein [Bdellovibrionia bacterium]
MAADIDQEGDHTDSARETFCPVPWIQSSVRNNGTFRVCCQCSIAPGGGNLLDENGKVYNAKNVTPAQTRNAQLLKDVRKSLLNGEKHPVCRLCWDEEAKKIESKRQNETRISERFFRFEHAEAITAPDGSIPKDTPIMSWDIRFGNLCNLKCVMCGPYDSSSWYNDFAELFGDEFHDIEQVTKLTKRASGNWLPEDDPYNWHDGSAFWEQLEKSSPKMKKIYLAGGEPLLIERHYEFLRMCVDKGIAGEIELDYATNGTRLPQKALELWSHFRHVNVNVSVDGIGPVIEYIRRGTRWADVAQNLKRLDETGSNVFAGINATVSALNVRYMPDLREWIVQQQFKKIKYFGHYLVNPPQLNMRILPLAAKAKIRERYERHFAEFGEHEGMRGYLTYMDSVDAADQFRHLREYVGKLDQRHGLSFETALPELSAIL